MYGEGERKKQGCLDAVGGSTNSPPNSQQQPKKKSHTGYRAAQQK